MTSIAKTFLDTGEPAAGFKYSSPTIPSCLSTQFPGGFTNHHRVIRPGTNTNMTIAHSCNPKSSHLQRHPIPTGKRFKAGKLMLLTKFARTAHLSTNPVVKKTLACIANANNTTPQLLCKSQNLGTLFSRPPVDTPLCNACGVIYAVINTRTGDTYVGQSLRQPITRFLEHLAMARCAQNGTITNQLESRFYRAFALDHRPWRLLILEKIPHASLDLSSNINRRKSFAVIANLRERAWINRLRSSSTYSHGMNSAHTFMYEHRPKRIHSRPNLMQHNVQRNALHNHGAQVPIINAHVGTARESRVTTTVVNRGGTQAAAGAPGPAVVNAAAIVSRAFGFRDDLRRIRYIQRIVSGTRSRAQNKHSLASYIRTFSYKTVTRMISFFMRRDTDAQIALYLTVPNVNLCLSILRQSPLLPPKTPSLLVIAHKSPLHNAVDFKVILKKACQYFPKAPDFPQHFSLPRVTFAYHQPLGQRLDNRNCFNKASTTNQYSLTSCMCNHREFRGFTSNKVGHVLTSDLNFIRQSSLRLKLSVGANYRHPPTETSACAKHEFLSALNKYADKLHVSNHLPSGFFDEWIRTCMHIYDSNKVVRSFTHTDANAPLPSLNDTAERTKPLFFTRQEQAYINHLQRNFIISSPDKSNNAFAFTCKSFYFHQAKEQISDRHQYNLLNTNATNIILRRTIDCVDKNPIFKDTKTR